MLPVQWTYLALAVVLASVTLVAAQAPPGWEEMGFGTASLFQYPTTEEYLLEVRLAGTATDASTREAWHVAVELSGVVTRTFTYGEAGRRAAEEAGDLVARVTFLDAQREAIVDAFDVPVAYHATRVDGVAQALDAWTFAFRAPEDRAAPFWLGASGEATGLEVQDGQVQHLLLAKGQAVGGDSGHKASQFRLDLGGHAREQRLD